MKNSVRPKRVGSLSLMSIQDTKPDPKIFDWFPPTFEQREEKGWFLIAKSIIKNDDLLINAIERSKKTNDWTHGHSNLSPKNHISIFSSNTSIPNLRSKSIRTNKKKKTNFFKSKLLNLIFKIKISLFNIKDRNSRCRCYYWKWQGPSASNG